MFTARKRVGVATCAGLALAGVTMAAAPVQADDVVDIQILSTNDFHGRILDNPFGGEAGAAVLAGAVNQLRDENPNTIFASSGDIIGASTFESFIQMDKPTIDAHNLMGLDVSAVGNHEFDLGFDDLTDRVMAPFDADTNPYGGAEWAYIGANVRDRATGEYAVPPSWVTQFGDIEVGFVGAVTEDMPALVTPAGIADIEFTSIVDETNTAAADLKAAGVDIVVLLVHEGSPTADCAAMPSAPMWGDIVTGVSADVDAIVSGHTHLTYDCTFPVAGWEDRAVTERPVVSAGSYGVNLNQLVYQVDSTTGEVVGVQTDVLPLFGNYPADPAVAALVADAVEVAEELGAAPLGEIAGVFNRARLADGAENRGGESTLGNLVAEVQRWATEIEEAGGADLAFMNPGGLRADMAGLAGEFPRTLTYKQAAIVQPFANTLVNMQLTGEQVKTALEQQWQRDGDGNVPSRPFLRLGVSAGFVYTFDADLPEGDRITGMWLDGEPIDLAGSYSVTVNSFLASGGDNFRVFAEGSGARDTGRIDLSAMVDYMAELTEPLAVDYSQRAVGVSFPSDAPEAYVAGDDVAFGVSSWSMSTADDVTDAEITVSLDGDVLGSFVVDTTAGTDPSDEIGAAEVVVTLPDGVGAGTVTLVLSGEATGTSVPVDIDVEVAGQAGPNPWYPSGIYVTGDVVQHEGVVYEARWWTRNQEPGAGVQRGKSPVVHAGPWLEVGPADAAPAVVPCATPWDATMTYTGGEVVSHEGDNYLAQWWTRNQEPGASAYGPWAGVQPCA